MSTELTRLFAALGDRADPRVLPDPAWLRLTAERRTRNGRWVAALAGVAAAAATVLTVAMLRTEPRALVPAGPVTSAPPSTVASPTPSTVVSSAPPVVRPAGADCRADDLDPRPYYDGEGAAGTVLSYVIVRNRASTSCRLASYPVLYTGATVLPTEPVKPRQDPVLLAPGRYAQLSVAHANCPGDRRYQNISVALAGGQRFPLPAYQVAADCGPLELSPWTVSVFPSPVGANPTRAPGS